MPFFTGNASFQGHQMVQMLIKNSSIHSTALDMNLRPITSVKNPIHPQDAATRWYVDSKIDEFSNTLENPYSGYLVTLSGTEPTDITNLRTGSYMVTVTPQKDGYPTALFAISKGSVYSEGHIFKVTGVSGEYTPEQLELIWPPGNVLQLKKTGPGFDGEYIVDMNMKNTSDIANPPEIPTDICDKAYVDRCIREQLDIRFGGRIVSLKETEVTKVMNLRCGSYMIAITPLQMDGAPTACFTVSKNSASASASIIRTSGCVGLSPYAEQLDLTWPENSMLLLAKTGPGYDGQYLVDMNLKNFSSIPEALIPSDAATCAYVDSQIERRMEAKFSGNIVRLVDTLSQNVENLRPGSYVIAVTSLVYGGPSATFAISKNSPFVDASIMRTSSCPGLETGEILELIWPENKMLALRKTGPFYDGDYLVDYNLKNISPTPTVPVFPDDQASKDYVDHQIKANLELELEGVTVNLEDTAFAQVCALRYGSYLIAVTALVYGGPTATFAVSKSSSGGQPSICRITSCPAIDTGEQLELIWPENSKIMLRKTGPMHDGAYLFDMNLKNFTGAAPSVITTDIATRDFVHEMIEQRMFTHFSGYEVFLQDEIFVPVAALNPGSYVLAVTSKVVQGPTTTFAVSKSSFDGEASVVKITSCPGREGEQLELIWPANAKLQIRKTGKYCNGRYIIDMTLKNVTSAAPTPTAPLSKTAIEEIFHEQVAIQLKEYFSGIEVPLLDDQFTSVADLHPGSYLIGVTSRVYGGPTATFVVSKATTDSEASIVRLSSYPSEDGQQIDFSWPGGKRPQIRKSGPGFDGTYLVDINRKQPVQPHTSIPNVPNISNTTSIRLDKQLVTSIPTPLKGSFTLHVSPVEDGPAACFLVSRSNINRECSQYMVTSTSGDPALDDEVPTKLVLSWPLGEAMRLNKTTDCFDGMYEIKLF